MVWLYNSRPINGHYSPAICVKDGKAETLEIVEKFIRGKGYDPEVDRLERKALHLWRWKEGSNYKDLESSDSDEDALKEAGEEAKRKKEGDGKKGELDVLKEQKKVIESLKSKVENLEKKSQIVEKIRKIVGGGVIREEEEERGVLKKRGFEAAVAIQSVSKGDTMCTVCCKDMGSTRNLKRHIDQFHKREFRYYCKECKRIYEKSRVHNTHGNT